MFESTFEKVPMELRLRLEKQLEAAILEGVQRVRKGDGNVLPCVIRASEVMILAGAFGHSSRKGSREDTGAKEGQEDGS